MMVNIPGLLSLLTQKNARTKMKTVTGIAAIVRYDSMLPVPCTTTRNRTVKAKKKKKSNFNRER